MRKLEQPNKRNENSAREMSLELQGELKNTEYGDKLREIKKERTRGREREIWIERERERERERAGKRQKEIKEKK